MPINIKTKKEHVQAIGSFYLGERLCSDLRCNFC